MTILFTVLMLTVILIGGWSSASNAITGSISAHVLSPEHALRLASVCTFVGAFGTALIYPAVARTIYGIVDFGQDRNAALSALCAGLFAVIIWSIIARRFGIPNSETHALLSGMSGAALAGEMGFSAINIEEWRAVLLGFFLSTVPAFLLALGINCFYCRYYYAGRNRRRVIRRLSFTQTIGCATCATIHGAQDCQKFMGVYLLGLSLGYPQASDSLAAIPLSIILICSATMALGTLFGGLRGIKKLGCDMTSLDAPSCGAANTAASAAMALCTFLGLPASFTHARACAIMGSGTAIKNRTNPRVALQFIGAWCLTFPVCGAIGFLLSFPITHSF